MSEATSDSVISKTAAQFTAQDPVLGLNQIGIESDTLLMKQGDKIKAWNDLDYVVPSPTAFEQVLSCRVDKVASSKAICDGLGTVPGGTVYGTSINVDMVGNQNDLTVVGLVDTSILRMTSTSPISITGLLNPTADRRKLYIFNVGTKNITFTNNSGLSLAANRFLLGQNRQMQPDEGISILYDSVSARWRAHGMAI